jgi:acyl-CoA dehydrogenase
VKTTLIDPFSCESLPGEARQLAAEVRQFLTGRADSGRYTPKCDAWLSGFDSDFSGELGARGWLGVTWPTRYGGRGLGPLERYVVLEELLIAGAPVAAHWIAERQIGPALLRHGSEFLRQAFLPGIAAGRTYFALGMSEPDSGSDLASVRTRATRVPGGWRIHGRKVWTSHAHNSHWMVTLCRTGDVGDNRHSGLSQLIVDLAAPGVTVSPLTLMTGEHHFNEVVLDDVFVPGDYLLGEEGDGWRQVTSELAIERSGPERFLSTYPLLRELMRRTGSDAPDWAAERIGKLLAELVSLRQLSIRVAAAVSQGAAIDILAATVKDLGTMYESEVVEVARDLGRLMGEPDSRYKELFDHALLSTPGFTLRGGTNEILRGVVVRGIGL